MSSNSVEVGGDQNRVAGRDYVEINMGREQRKIPLVPAQSQELYGLGIRCTELGADSKDTWRRVFAELGVKQIDDITADQFLQARNVLQARLNSLVDEDDKRRLVGKILRTATEKDAKAELNNFCDLTFGRTHLNNLQRAELQRALEFVQGFQIRPLAEVPTEPAKPSPMPLREFLSIHRVNAVGLFVFGIVVGKLLF